MLFNSYLFIFLFLPIVLGIYYLLAQKKPQFCIPWLIVTSLTFYGWWSTQYLSLIIISILVNYLLGKLLIQAPKKWMLLLGLGFNLCLILIFKYTDFLLENTSQLFQVPITLPHFVLPLAISFFTFQQIAYLVDCYQKKVAKSEFLKYCLFILFFPQLIAGPIVQQHQMIPQFENKHFFKLNTKHIALGLSIFILGLFKKVMIADTLATFANPIFQAAEMGVALSFFEGWWGTIAYTLQLYFDFSGYSDMAIGLALLFNIKLPINFNSPYKAINIIDFWRRWHITLSTFLRDYLYIPLGGNRKGTWSRHQNLMLTMLLGGLWHGANWNFMIWGGLHGFYLMVNHSFRTCRSQLLGHDLTQSTMLGKVLSQGLTLICVMIAWVFFRAHTYFGATQMLKAMFGFNGISLLQTFEQKFSSFAPWLIAHGVTFDGLFINELADLKQATLLIVAGALVALFMPNTQQTMLKGYQLNGRYLKLIAWQKNIVWGSIIGILGMLSILSLAKASDFIYFQF